MNVREDARVAWKPRSYALALDKSLAWLYAQKLQPISVKIGHSRLITEAPQDYLARLVKYYDATVA
jgi:hypothetical protein